MKTVLEKIKNGKMQFLDIPTQTDTPTFTNIFDSFEFKNEKVDDDNEKFSSQMYVRGIGPMSGGQRFFSCSILYGKNKGKFGFAIIPNGHGNRITGFSDSMENARAAAKEASMKILTDLFIWNKKDLEDNEKLFHRFEKAPEKVIISGRPQ